MDPVILASLLSTAGKGVIDSLFTGLANRYNSPRQQLKRLRRAGLPQSFMYSGRVNTQSNVPELSIDPSLGVVQSKQLGLGQQKVDLTEDQVAIAMQKLGIDFEKLGIDYRKQAVSEGKLKIEQGLADLKGRLTDEQIQKLQAEIEFLKPKTDIAKGEAAAKLKIGESGLSAQEKEIQLGLAIQGADLFIKRQEGQIKRIAKEVDQATKQTSIMQRTAALEKIKAETIKAISQDATLRQLIDIRAIDAEVGEVIGEFLQNAEANGDDYIVGLYALLVKLISKL